jgi:hypothetical protein
MKTINLKMSNPSEVSKKLKQKVTYKMKSDPVRVSLLTADLHSCLALITYRKSEKATIFRWIVDLLLLGKLIEPLFVFDLFMW